MRDSRVCLDVGFEVTADGLGKVGEFLGGLFDGGCLCALLAGVFE